MMEFLKNIDRQLFLFLNGLHADWIDPIMKVFTANWFWIPVIVLIVFLLIKYFKKQFWIPLLVVIVCFAITDQVSNQTKKSVKRYRPSHNTEIKDKVYVVDDYWGGQYSFFSGHAANGFGLAVLTLLYFKNKYYSIFILIWAFFVSYSRIYVGVHYPSDIIVGAIFGTAMAFLLYYLHKKIPCLRIKGTCSDIS